MTTRFRITLLALVFAVALAGPALAQSKGKIVEKGVEMPVKSVVGIWIPKDAQVKFMLLPFDPTPEQITAFQQNDYMFMMMDAKTPDPKKWPDGSPYASLSLSWPMDKANPGDVKKAFVYIYSYSVGTRGSNINVNLFGKDQTGLSLTGALKEGEEVTLVYKGTHDLGLSWDLNLKAKLLPSLAK